MIKIASNLEKLAIERSWHQVPSTEQQIMEALNPSAGRSTSAKRRALINSLLGAGSGALLGGAVGAPFAGVGAVPGAIVGGLGGALLVPRLMEMAARPQTAEGAEIAADPEVKDLLNSIAKAKTWRAVKTVGGGAGIGALAGLPFAGVGAIPGAALGALGGAIYNRSTDNPEVQDILATEEAMKLKKQLNKIISKNKLD